MTSKIQKHLLYAHVVKHACIWLFVWMFLATGMPGFGGTIEELRTKSDEGDCEARYQLAILLEKGEGIKKDMSKALFLLKLAAEEDHKNAKSKLYSLLNDLKSKASGGDAESEYLLGSHFFWGEESEKKEGFQKLLKLAESGHSSAQYDVGLILLGEYTNEACVQSYYNGNGRTRSLIWYKINQLSADHVHVIPTDTLKGQEWLQKSAESKNIEAMKYLFQAYIQGRNYIPRNYEKAYKLAQQRLKLKDPAAAMSLGAMYFKGVGVKPNSEKALEYWNMASDMGLEGAKFFLAQQYNPNIWENFDYMGKKTEFTGADGWEDFKSEGPMWFLEDGDKVVLNGIRKPDEAVKLLKEIVKNHDEYGYPNDEYENALGNAYFLGEGVEQDFKEAIKWWERAAVKRPNVTTGNTYALYHLGMAYKNGHGVSRDMAKAIEYFKMSAKWYPHNSARELLEIYNQQIKEPKAFLEKAESVEIWDELIWEFLDKKSKKFTKIKEMGYSLGEVFDHLAATNRSIDDVSKSINLAEKIEKELHLRWISYQLQLIKNAEAADKVLPPTFPAKLALLISNSQYTQFGRLALTESDARSLANVLGSLGFEVYLVKNASREQMLQALKGFEEKLRGKNALAFFHYGGHGVQVGGKNYLIPADADIPDELRVATRAVDLDEVIAVIESAKPKASVLVVDACRHNPLPATPTRSATRGLAVVGRKPKNSVIIFAAEAGSEAMDGLFTPVFAKILAIHRDKSLNQVMQKVRSEVFNKSNGSQTPGEYNQLFEDVYFSPQN